MALKECIRARAQGKVLSFQYRRSKLTQALKCSFALPTARTIVIATVSPASKDTEHSLNTLRHACIMHGQQDGSNSAAGRETRFVTGGTVTTETVGEINLTEIGRRNLAIKRSGGTLDDAKTSNGNLVSDSRAARAANNEAELTEKDRLRQRKAAEARSIAKLLPQYRDLLRHHREQLGRDRHQAARLQRAPLDPSSIIQEEEDCEGYASPPRTPSGGEGYSDGDGEGEEVDEEVAEFHSSLTKNKDKDRDSGRDPGQRLDMRKLAISDSGGRDNGRNRGHQARDEWSGDESVEEEDEVVQAVGRHVARPSTSSSRPSSAAVTRPGSANALRPGSSGGRQDRQDPGMPQLRSQAGREAVLHVRRPPSADARTPRRDSDHTSRSTPRDRAVYTSPAPSEPAVRPSPSTQRIEFQRLYDTIYAAAADGVPETVLRRQLTSLLTLHGYTEREIDMMFQMQALIQENVSMKRAAEEKQSTPARPKRRDSDQGPSTKPAPRPELYPVDRPTAAASVSHSPPVAVEVKRAALKHSPAKPVARAVQPAAEPEEAPVAQKRSASVGRPAAVAAASEQRQRVLAEGQRRAAEDKERRERDAVAEAAALLEQQAAVKRARQEAARQLREQQEDDRRQKAARNAAASRSTKQSLFADKPAEAPTSKRVGQEDVIATQSIAAAFRAGIREKEDEIAALVEQLQAPGNSESAQYALRKNIATRKAALLRDRREAAQKSYLDEEDAMPAPQAAVMKGAARYAAKPVVVMQHSPPHQYVDEGDHDYVQSARSRFAAARPQVRGFDDMPVGGGRQQQHVPGSEYNEYARAQPRVTNSRERGALGGRGDTNGATMGRTDAFGGPRWDTEDHAHNNFLSPRSPNRPHSQQGGAQGSPGGGAERSGRRVVGAAAAPFGNDYSWEAPP
jgi:hypothetical protein